jgi:tetratricopeptide (TPR) repeat protein
MLIAATARPELYDRVPGWATSVNNSNRINLSPLTDGETARLVSSLVASASLPPDVYANILRRAGGNPFFAEEFVRLLRDQGILRNHIPPAVNGGRITVPPAVEGIIAARLDALPPDRRRLIQDAAIVGDVFWSGALVEMGGVHAEEVRDGLHELARAELIRPVRTSSMAGHAQFVFVHSLVREVAYAQIPRSRLADRHQRAAEWIESVAAERVEDHAEILAAHFLKAATLEHGREGDPARELRAKAVRYLTAAGDRAVGLDPMKAASHYGRAMDLDGTLSPVGTEGTAYFDLVSKKAWALHLAGDHAAATDAIEEAVRGYRLLGEARQTGRALALQGRIHFLTGGTREAGDSLSEAIDLLRPEGGTPELLQALIYASAVNSTTGEVEDGRSLALSGLELVGSAGGEASRASLATSLGVMEVLAGDAGGLARIKQAVTVTEPLGETEPLARAYINLAIALREMGAHEEGLEASRRGMDAMARMGAHGYESVMRAQEATILVQGGRLREGIDRAHEVIDAGRAPTPVPARLFAGRALAAGLLQMGRLEEARSALDEFVPLARRVGAALFALPLYALAADLEVANGDSAAARRSAAEAVEVALGISASALWYSPLVAAARAGALDDARRLLAAAARRATFPISRARLDEAEGLVANDASRLRAAAEGYAALGLRFEEARCRLVLGDERMVEAICTDFGFSRTALAPSGELLAF